MLHFPRSSDHHSFLKCHYDPVAMHPFSCYVHGRALHRLLPCGMCDPNLMELHPTCLVYLYMTLTRIPIHPF